MKKIEFTNEQIEEILKLYSENKTQKFIAEQFNVSRTVIKRILEQHLSQEQIRKTTNKYKAEYRIFSNIDSAEKAYWLGFLAADGCVYVREKNASIIINIHEKDCEILEKFQKFMNSDVQIQHYIQTQGYSNNTPMVKLTFNSVDMAQDLIKVGITPRKSLTLKPPQIEEQFYLPFILGYFDGDGSIYQLKNNEYGINIIGTKEMLNWINNILNISKTLEQREVSDKNNYYIRCGGTKKPLDILTRLYNSCPIHLQRKYDKYLELLNSRP